MTDYVPLPHEDTTRPRWRCLITGNLEYARPSDRSSETSRRRLAKQCLCGNAKRHVYRAGLLLGRVGGPVAPLQSIDKAAGIERSPDGLPVRLHLS